MKKGFTMVEVLITLSILGVMLGIGIPFSKKYVTTFQEEKLMVETLLLKQTFIRHVEQYRGGCFANLESIGLAYLFYPFRSFQKNIADDVEDQLNPDYIMYILNGVFDKMQYPHILRLYEYQRAIFSKTIVTARSHFIVKMDEEWEITFYLQVQNGTTEQYDIGQIISFDFYKNHRLIENVII